METQGGGYTWWFNIYIYSGQSLSDGKDRSLSAKVWNSDTTFLNCTVSHNYVHKLITTQLSGFLGAFSLSDRNQANLSVKVC